jgi:hypothetical protein
MNSISTLREKAMTDTITYTPAEDEMLDAYARFRLDGVNKESALAYLFTMDYAVTPNVIHAINNYDKHIFSRIEIKNLCCTQFFQKSLKTFPMHT